MITKNMENKLNNYHNKKEQQMSKKYYLMYEDMEETIIYKYDNLQEAKKGKKYQIEECGINKIDLEILTTKQLKEELKIMDQMDTTYIIKGVE